MKSMLSLWKNLHSALQQTVNYLLTKTYQQKEEQKAVLPPCSAKDLITQGGLLFALRLSKFRFTLQANHL